MQNVFYIRPNLLDIPLRFRTFLVLNFEKVLNEFFNVTIFELSNKKDNSLILPQGADIIVIQVLPDFGLTNYQIQFKDSQVPKIGYLAIDSFSPCRYDAFSYFRSLGVDAYFVSDVSMGMRYKAIREKLFYMPWFLNSDDLECNQDEIKTEFLLLTGHNNGTYPWRNNIYPLLKRHYNTTQLQYFSLYGKDFLRYLSKAKYIPTDGGFGRIIVNKHLEIPASKSCLITQPSEAVLSMGFIDMENCIMANSLEELAPKIENCESNDDKYQTIVEKGFQLIKNNHTQINRTQLIEWYQMHKVKDVKEKIIQPELFGALELVSKDSQASSYVQITSDDKMITDEIDLLISEGKFEDALKKCNFLITEFSDYCPDFLLRKSIICIGLHEYSAAVKCIQQLLSIEIRHGKAEQPDPVEWGMLLLSFHLGGQRKIVSKLLDFFDYNDDSFVNVIKAGIAVSLNKINLASYFISQSLQLGEESFSSHCMVPQKFNEVLEWIKRVDSNITFPVKELVELSKEVTLDNAPLRNISTKKAALEKCYYVEYYSFNYTGSSSFISLLKNRLRLLRDVAKVRMKIRRV